LKDFTGAARNLGRLFGVCYCRGNSERILELGVLLQLFGLIVSLHRDGDGDGRYEYQNLLWVGTRSAREEPRVEITGYGYVMEYEELYLEGPEDYFRSERFLGTRFYICHTISLEIGILYLI